MPRVIRRHGAYVAFAIASLALAVGATLVVFTVVNAVRRGYGVSDRPPSGAMAMPPTAAAYSGDVSTPFETSATTE